MIRRPTLLLVALVVAITCAGPLAAEEGAPSWEGLLHEPPEWLLDAKFGIYMHWGVYSVPAFRTEWYPKKMYELDSAFGKHHREKYGDPKDFPYHKFVPLFKAEKYNAEAWAKLMKASGARYAGMAVVHHDGFLLWDSKVNRWNAANMGPKRDCYGEYVKALRAEGLKTIATFHHLRTFNWYLPGVGGMGGEIPPEQVARIKAKGWAITDPEYGDLYWNELAGGTYEDFLNEWQAEVKEVIDNYRPDLIWFDGGKFQGDEVSRRVRRLLAYYRDCGEKWGKPVEVLNKLSNLGRFNFPRDYGVLTFEEGRDRTRWVDRPWIDDMKISDGGWCYVEGQHYKSANEVIDGLVDRTARGGGLLLNISPKADGSVPDEQLKTLLGVGDWLRINGEAIYATRPWKHVGEGDEAKLQGRAWTFSNCDGTDIRFTRSKDATKLYVIVLGWPKAGKLRIATLSEQTKIAPGGITKITALDGERPVEFRRNAVALFLTLPKELGTDEPAYALRIDLAGPLNLTRE